MASVAALYRYPVKSLNPESVVSLRIQEDGRIAGDRVLGFRFADTPEPDDEWSRKFGMLALVNTPSLARLRVKYDDDAQRLRIELEGRVLADERLDVEGRRRLCEAMAAYALQSPEGALAGHPEHLPLRLIGDGRTPRYHDRPPGYVTLHGRGSLRALADAFADPGFSEVRFRSNVALEGIEAWEEQTWVGRELSIGAVRFRAHAPVVRCLATHANPLTGERDRPVLTTLTRSFGQEEPTFAIALVPLGPGEVRVGDEVRLDAAV
jgi:uncharacterized protein YcbX